MKKKQFKYKAFLSYSHADTRHARQIHRFIETYSIPKHLASARTSGGSLPRHLRPVFKDRDELPTAADLGEKVNAALAESEFLIVVCSPHSAASRWVNEEVQRFKRMGRAGQILCIIVAGEPNASDIPGREEQECFCEALRFRLDSEGRPTSKHAEPVAGMVVTLMLAWAAVVARDDAERRRDQADDLIGFMLGELRGRLEEVGRLDVMDSVAGKAMTYFEDLPSKDLTDKVLGNRAEAFLQLGQVQLTRGNHEEAMQAFSQSLQANEELSARDPTNLERLFAVGQAHFWVGYVHWENNDLDAADASLRRYYEKSLALYEGDPDNNDYILELGYAYNNLAILSERRGEVPAAIDYNQRMIDLSRSALEHEPENETYRLALADAYSWSGSILRSDCQFAASTQSFESYLRLAEKASNANPSDTKWIDHRMYAHRFAGEAALALGQSGAASSHFEAGLSLADELLSIEAENDLWQIERAVLAERVAHMLIRSGQTEPGLSALDALQAEVRARMADGTERTDWFVIDSQIELFKAQAALAAGDLERAAAISGPLEITTKNLLKSNPSSKRRKSNLVNSLILAARIAETKGESSSADMASTWQETLRTIENLDPDRSDPDLRDAYIRASLYAGRGREIEEEIRAFLATGYRQPDFVEVLQAFEIESPGGARNHGDQA